MQPAADGRGGHAIVRQWMLIGNTTDMASAGYLHSENHLGLAVRRE